MATNDMPPMMVMTSPKTWWTLGGFFYLLEKYVPKLPRVYLFGYDENASDAEKYIPAHFYSFGRFADWPRDKWSDTFITAMRELETTGHDTFWFMMDDYWLIRQVDTLGLIKLNQYMRELGDIVKIDLATDRLYAKRGEPYLYGKGTIDRVGYLDIIESDPVSDYHMSLWSGLWNINLLNRVIIRGESAQEIEINGTARLGSLPHLRVLGTRQAPVLHTNIVRGGGPPVYTGYPMDGVDVNYVHPMDLVEMRLSGRVEIR